MLYPIELQAHRIAQNAGSQRTCKDTAWREGREALGAARHLEPLICLRRRTHAVHFGGYDVLVPGKMPAPLATITATPVPAMKYAWY